MSEAEVCSVLLTSTTLITVPKGHQLSRQTSGHRYLHVAAYNVADVLDIDSVSPVLGLRLDADQERHVRLVPSPPGALKRKDRTDGDGLALMNALSF